MPPKRKAAGKRKTMESSDSGEDGPLAAASEILLKQKSKSARVAAQTPKGQITSGAITITRVDKDGVIILHPLTIEGSEEIVSFDMDDTLISTRSGKTFATGRSDWQWKYPEIPGKLKQINASGKRVVIFTNQAGIAKKGFDESKATMICGKIADIMASVGFAFYAFLSTKDSEYRKPSTGMWGECEELFGLKLSKDGSRYVGDAAGREKDWAPGKKKDFSCSDRKFAYNLGIQFDTPEVFFRGDKDVPFSWGGIGPDDLPQISVVKSPPASVHAKSTPELVVMVGFPASGKSTFAKNQFVSQGYEWINRDTLKTKEKCWKFAEAALAAGKRVVIDNTNPSAADRKVYIDMANASGVPARCFWMQASFDFANHMNYYRERMGISDHVPGIAYNIYKKGFEEPKISEGFASVEKVEFQPCFTDEKSVEIFRQLPGKD